MTPNGRVLGKVQRMALAGHHVLPGGAEVDRRTACRLESRVGGRMHRPILPCLEIAADQRSLGFDQENGMGKVEELLKCKIGDLDPRPVSLIQHEVGDGSRIVWTTGHLRTSTSSSWEVVPLA